MIDLDSPMKMKDDEWIDELVEQMGKHFNLYAYKGSAFLYPQIRTHKINTTAPSNYFVVCWINGRITYSYKFGLRHETKNIEGYNCELHLTTVRDFYERISNLVKQYKEALNNEKLQSMNKDFE